MPTLLFRLLVLAAFSLLVGCTGSLSPEEAYLRADAAAGRGDHSSAARWYAQAAEAGHARALWAQAGVPVHELEQPGGALLYRIPLDGLDTDRLARAGAALQTHSETPEARYALGLAAWNGWGIEQDTLAAHAWMQQAAASGHLNAQLWLGQWGVLYDPASSAAPLRQAIDGATLLPPEAGERVRRQAYAALSNAVMAHHLAEGDTTRAFTAGYAVLAEAAETTGDPFWNGQRDQLLDDLAAGMEAGSPSALQAAEALGLTVAQGS